MMKNDMNNNTNTNAKRNPDEWLRPAIEKWLERNHPQAKTWKEKAEALNIPQSVLYEYLRGGKSLRFGTAVQLIDIIGGDLTLALPDSKAAKRMNVEAEKETFSLRRCDDRGKLSATEPIDREVLCKHWDGFQTLDIKPSTFFIQQGPELLMFEPGPDLLTALRKVVAKICGKEEQLVELQSSWSDKKRRESLVILPNSSSTMMVPNKDIEVKGTVVATFHIARAE